MLGREVHQPQDIQSGAAELKSEWMDVADFLYKLKEELVGAHNPAKQFFILCVCVCDQSYSNTFVTIIMSAVTKPERTVIQPLVFTHSI